MAGGTTGHIYNMDIWRIEREFGRRKSFWKCAQLNRQGYEVGRYRLEIAVHGQNLYTFGGGAPDFCAEFNEVEQKKNSQNQIENKQIKIYLAYNIIHYFECLILASFLQSLQQSL